MARGAEVCSLKSQHLTCRAENQRDSVFEGTNCELNRLQIEGIVPNSERYSHVPSCRELDEVIINSLMAVKYVARHPRSSPAHNQS